MDCTTADTSLASADGIRIQQRIEGQNLQYLKKGTSSAESLTFSFWVKSSKTGTYTLEIQDQDNSRFNAKTYTVDTANTWEKKIITFDGDTTGTLDNDNASSLTLHWWLGAGTNFTSGTFHNGTWGTTTANRVSSSQVNLADSTSNEWYITGVQLEAGQVASDFEFLPTDVNLKRCQRYFYQITGNTSGSTSFGTGFSNSGTENYANIFFPTMMRSIPSITSSSGLQVTDANSYTINATGASVSQGHLNGMNVVLAVSSGLTTLRPGINRMTNSTSSHIAFSSEL